MEISQIAKWQKLFMLLCFIQQVFPFEKLVDYKLISHSRDISWISLLSRPTEILVLRRPALSEKTKILLILHQPPLRIPQCCSTLILDLQYPLAPSIHMATRVPSVWHRGLCCWYCFLAYFFTEDMDFFRVNINVGAQKAKYLGKYS